MGFLRGGAFVVSMITSGDERVRKEYIHPPATLMAHWDAPASYACRRPLRRTAALFACRDLEAFKGFDRLKFRHCAYPHHGGIGRTRMEVLT